MNRTETEQAITDSMQKDLMEGKSIRQALQTLTKYELVALLDIIYKDGTRRGFGRYWWERGE